MRISDWSSDVCSSDLVLWEPPWRLPLKVQYTHGEGRKSFPMFRFDGTGRGVAGAHLGATGFAGKAGRAQVRSYNTDCGTDGVRTHMSNIESLSTQALADIASRSEEHTSELQSLMRISYAVFCLKKKKYTITSKKK